MDLSPLQYGSGAGAGSLVGFTLGLVGGGGSILAVPLIVLSLLLNRNGQPAPSPPPAAAALISLQETVAPVANRILMVDVITGIGAGIYEELIFRLILVCLLMMVFQVLTLKSVKSLIG